jgi:hypothetical protein
LLLLLLIPLSAHKRRIQREILLPQSLASSCLFMTEEDLRVTKGEFTGMYKKQAAQGFATHKRGNSQACAN